MTTFEAVFNQLDQLSVDADLCHSTTDSLDHILSSTHHPIMVPFGNKAFFKGELQNTNCFKVHLGSGIYVDKTNKETAEYLNRKEHRIRNQMKFIEKSIRAECRQVDRSASQESLPAQDHTITKTPEGYYEIREPCDTVPKSTAESKKAVSDSGAVKASIMEHPSKKPEKQTESRPMSKFKKMRAQAP
ncbi:hypothetical protein GEMRC1_007382 [Eukaryota sp. GEM-RC1]